MSELEDKLNSLLSNQDAMAQVMQLAQSLRRFFTQKELHTHPALTGGE